MVFKTLQQVQNYLEPFVQNISGPLDGAYNFERTKELMRLIGDPQNKLKVIHVAGTSGKGSTCFTISKLLESLGFKVGLTVSPHLLDLRERTQVNNALISEERYGTYLSEIIPGIEALQKTKWGAPSYFEITIALAYHAFWKENVDYAVIETGLGGRYDATNTLTLTDKLCIFSKIGFDHVEFLGNTIGKIAAEKAHIIQNENQVLSAPQLPEAKKVLDQVAHEKKTTVKYIDVKENLNTSLHGSYQKENISLALAAVYALSKRDSFDYDGSIVRKALMNLNFPGRFEIIKKADKTIILDGAHNPQKMQAFIESLIKEYPDKKFDFLISFKKGKNYKEMLEYIVPLAKRITITSFTIQEQGMMGESDKNSQIEQKLIELGFKNYESIEDSKEAYKKALKEAKEILVVTGSLYLLSEIYHAALANSSKVGI